jgi:WhiB family redox-sensing transcriptional regulator
MAFTNTAVGLDSGTINGDWRGAAVCKDEDPDLMYPLPAIGPGELWLIREYCFACQVRLRCLQDGVEVSDWESIRGVLTGRERAKHYRAGLEPHEFPLPVKPTCAVCFRVTWLPLRKGRCGSCRVTEQRAAKREQVAS